MEDRAFNIFPEISTERLKLRAIKQEDAEYIYKILSNPEVIKYDTFELFTDISQAESLIKWFNDEFKEKRAIFWGISFKNMPEIIGFCKCEIEVPKVRVDLGYDLMYEYWNKGIMTETLSAVIEFIFKTLDVNRIEASVSSENKSSIRVLEKSGFVKEGVLRERSYMGDILHDMIMLSILKKEYFINQLSKKELFDEFTRPDEEQRKELKEKIKSILEKEKLLYLATTNNKYPDNSAVCFAYDEKLHLYFGSYSDTLKCKNISQNPYVAVSIGTLQIHGIAKVVPYGSDEYKNKRKIYDKRFPQYVSIFEKVDNELYEITPFVIWNYNPSIGEMNRDELIINLEYYKSISPYKFHKYNER